MDRGQDTFLINSLTHFGLVTPYVSEILVNAGSGNVLLPDSTKPLARTISYCHQRHCGIHQRDISQEMFMNLNTFIYPTKIIIFNHFFIRVIIWRCKVISRLRADKFELVSNTFLSVSQYYSKWPLRSLGLYCFQGDNNFYQTYLFVWLMSWPCQNWIEITSIKVIRFEPTVNKYRYPSANKNKQTNHTCLNFVIQKYTS